MWARELGCVRRKANRWTRFSSSTRRLSPEPEVNESGGQNVTAKFSSMMRSRIRNEIRRWWIDGCSKNNKIKIKQSSSYRWSSVTNKIVTSHVSYAWRRTHCNCSAAEVEASCCYMMLALPLACLEGQVTAAALMSVSMLAIKPKQGGVMMGDKRPSHARRAGSRLCLFGSPASLTSNSKVHLLRMAVLPEVCGELEHRHRRGLRDFAEDGHDWSGGGGGSRSSRRRWWRRPNEGTSLTNRHAERRRQWVHLQSAAQSDSGRDRFPANRKACSPCVVP